MLALSSISTISNLSTLNHRPTSSCPSTISLPLPTIHLLYLFSAIALSGSHQPFVVAEKFIPTFQVLLTTAIELF